MLERLTFIILEDGICYDNDDYGLWGAILINLNTKQIEIVQYGHGTGLRECLERKYNCEVELIGYDYYNTGNMPLSEEEVRKIILESLKEDFVRCVPFLDLEYLPCSVTGGRKKKGENLVYVKDVAKYNSYIANMYGIRKHEINYLIYDPANHTICEVNPKYVNIHYDELIPQIIDKAFKEGNSTHISSMAHTFAYRMSYASCDRENYRDSLRTAFMGNTYAVCSQYDIKGASNPWEEKRRENRAKKYAAAIEQEREKITKWANEKLANESEERKQEVIEKLVNKYKEKKGIL